MKTNYFFLLFFLLILMGCSDDKNIPDIPASTEDTYEGVHDLISFTKETEDFTYGDLTFYIKTPRGNIIQRKAKHRRLSGTSLFTMEKGLKEGKYQLLYMEYTIQSDCPDIDGRNGEFGMGCYITVSENGISTETNRDERIGLYGNGTPEDPYRITLLIPPPASSNKMTLAWPTIMTNAAGRVTGIKSDYQPVILSRAIMTATAIRSGI